MAINEHNCRVCGFYNDSLSWGEDGASPSYEICPCCGVEFGNEDYTLASEKRYREKWISDGLKWFNPKDKPSEWDMYEQFKSIPDKFL